MKYLFFIVLACFSASAEDVGDISADASAIYTGNTYHGYAEMRVSLQNRSHDRTHAVTLVYPNNSYGSYGNDISRLSRTVTLAPESAETVSLLLPPLPSHGDSLIRVTLDDGHEGEISAPNANNHCIYYRSINASATVFVSRSLDDDAVERLFQASQGAFTPAMAVGPPDAPAGGMQPACWVPDTRRYGATNWLELDYAKPQAVSRVSVYNTQSGAMSGSITLIGVSGTNIASRRLASGKSTWPGTVSIREYDFGTNPASVKSVRLDFARTPPYTIAIDAVQISGPSGQQWASRARASSDNSAQASMYRTGPATAEIESLRAETSVADWSETWLAYTPFDAVVIGAADLNTMSPGVFAALGNYLQAGGNILLFGASSLPEAWHPWAKQPMDVGVDYKIGFGQCFLFPSPNPAALDRASVRVVRTTVRDSAVYWQSLPRDIGAAESVLPVHENTKIPARSIVLIMLAFVIVIGPVNLILLNRYKRRTWMLWTIPAISVTTTMLVFVYSLLREGITPDVRIAGLTVLDQATHHAATCGGEAFYCPLTPGGGLHFDYGTEATPLVNIDSYRSGNSREVDWSQLQHLQRGWVSARVPAYFHLRESETRRERIEISGENGKLQVVNGLGAPIKSLWFADHDMKFYRAANIGAGQKGSLVPLPQSLPPDKIGPDGLRSDLGFGARNLDADGSAEKYLRPDTYIAVLDGNPFIEDALGRPRVGHAKIASVVFGIIDPSQSQ